MTDAERQARVQLAACYRMFHLLGWTEMIFNHITLRVPGPRSGVSSSTPSACTTRDHRLEPGAVDVEGNPVRPPTMPVNRAGFVIHSAIHGHVDQAHCVMHTHTTTGMAVACLKEGLRPPTSTPPSCTARSPTTTSKASPSTRTRSAGMLKSIGGKPARHPAQPRPARRGRPPVPEAFMMLWTLQRACDVQIAAGSAGATHPAANDSEARAQCVREAGPLEPAVRAAAYAALLRKLDQAGARYADSRPAACAEPSSGMAGALVVAAGSAEGAGGAGQGSIAAETGQTALILRGQRSDELRNGTGPGAQRHGRCLGRWTTPGIAGRRGSGRGRCSAGSPACDPCRSRQHIHRS